MRVGDVGDWWRLRRHIVDAWSFVRRRKHPGTEPAYEVRMRDGAPVVIRNVPMDRHIFTSIFSKDEYRLDGVAPGSLETVLDVGAHAGFFAVRCAPLAKRVISFEPIPENVDVLKRNVARYPNVVVRACAIGAERGRQKIHLSSNPAGHSLFASEVEGAVGAIEVDTITIEDAFREYAIERCGLLKLNCEGAEYAVLYGMPAALWGRIDRAVTSYHDVEGAPPAWTGDGLARHLEKMGHAVELVRSRKHPAKGRLHSVRK